MANTKRLYLAYGSNLNMHQMAHRCPTAKFIGSTTLEGYELTFRGHHGSGVATIEPKEGSSVPCGIWEIQPQDEKHLDVYEGYPRFYGKENVKVKLGKKTVTAMVYIMTEGYTKSIPSRFYYQTILDGYIECGLDEEVLHSAVRKVKTTISA